MHRHLFRWNPPPHDAQARRPGHQNSTKAVGQADNRSAPAAPHRRSAPRYREVAGGAFPNRNRAASRALQRPPGLVDAVPVDRPPHAGSRELVDAARLKTKPAVRPATRGDFAALTVSGPAPTARFHGARRNGMRTVVSPHARSATRPRPFGAGNVCDGPMGFGCSRCAPLPVGGYCCRHRR